MDIEKDIKRCEELIKPEHANWIGISNQLAIAHIIDRVKEVETDLTTVYLKGYEDCRQKYMQKVKNKIEKLKEKFKNTKSLRFRYFHRNGAIYLLGALEKELLEDK